MSIEVSILIPYIRPQNMANLVFLIDENAGIDRSRYEILIREDKERIGCPKMLAWLVDKSVGSKVMFLGDDTFPRQNFLKNALKAMALLPDGWGLVGLNDKTGRRLPCHWLADKRLLPKIGGEFFHTGYQHCFCDNELAERCQALGKFIYAYDSIVLHQHPLIPGTGGIWDADYSRVYSSNVMKADRKLFKERYRRWRKMKSN